MLNDEDKKDHKRNKRNKRNEDHENKESHLLDPVPLEEQSTFAEYPLLEGACLYFRRSIISLPASVSKERLLFYLDRLMEMDIATDLEGARNLIETLNSIAEGCTLNSDVRHHLAYLNDCFEKPLELLNVEMAKEEEGR